ncbi:MAG: hypothetical protein QXL94_01640 [Candidatus Parvarchaeum sp.]
MIKEAINIVSLAIALLISFSVIGMLLYAIVETNFLVGRIVEISVLLIWFCIVYFFIWLFR